MIIRRLTLTDYGPYAGEHSFDLEAIQNKPIILVGGRNGGGKTTLFESIPLCLYGHQLGRSGRRSYEERLRRLIHRYDATHMVDSERRTSVEVAFQISSGGDLTEYAVRRSWRATKDSISEDLDVKRSINDRYETLDLVEQDQWQPFVNGLVPPGIADLFFFDGEKVTQMAEKDRERSVIRAAFNSLLGLETAERLRDDLRTNLTRNLTGDDRHIRKDLDNLKADKEQAEQNVTRTRDARARKATDLDHIRDDIQCTEDKIEGLGGGYAKKRQDMRERLASKEAEAAILSRRISTLCAAELPLSMIPQHIDEILEQIKTDMTISQCATKTEMVADIAQRVQNVAAAQGIPDGTTAAILSVIRESAPKPDGAVEVLGLSNTQHERISGMAQRSHTTTLSDAADTSEQYGSARGDIERLHSMLESVPADDEIGPLVSETARLHTEAGRLEMEIEHLDMEITRQETLIRHTNARIRDKINTQYKSEKSGRMAQLTRAVDEALERYANKLRAKKIGLLEKYVQEAAQTLLHKRNFIGYISIDPESFEVTIYDSDNNIIPRDTLSKGELQMVATSILWGLARTSGRPLPFMIDTPLARLDTEHRFNLTERFFPLASHQILLFSTDTEIRTEDYARLLRYVSRAYMIRHDPDSAGTVVQKGYFWDGDKDEVR